METSYMVEEISSMRTSRPPWLLRSLAMAAIPQVPTSALVTRSAMPWNGIEVTRCPIHASDRIPASAMRSAPRATCGRREETA